MIYDISGKSISIGRGVNGSAAQYVYGINGEIKKRLDVIFEDNFNGSEIDSTKWSVRTGNYNNRYFMPEDYSNNLFINNGNLIVRNLKNNPAQGFLWSGTFIETRNKFYFQYGLLEARIKFPSDSPLYHATLWMMGENYDTDGWPYCGEIDIAETDNGSIGATLHYRSSDGQHMSKSIGAYPSINVSDWHVYRVLWTEESITVYVGNKIVGTIQTEQFTQDGYNPFRQPMFIMFNSNPYGLHNTENNLSDAVTNYIDYIRILQ